MKIIGKRSIASIIKVFLIILFILCILSMITVPMFIENNGEGFFKEMLLEQSLMIFLIFGIGLIVLREIYKTAIKNKEENDLTI